MQWQFVAMYFSVAAIAVFRSRTAVSNNEASAQTKRAKDTAQNLLRMFEFMICVND